MSSKPLYERPLELCKCTFETFLVLCSNAFDHRGLWAEVVIDEEGAPPSPSQKAAGPRETLARPRSGSESPASPGSPRDARDGALPSPATHSILPVFEAGESVLQTVY